MQRPAALLVAVRVEQREQVRLLRVDYGPGFDNNVVQDLCARHNVPTAGYRKFTDANLAMEYIRSEGAPIVVKVRKSHKTRHMHNQSH